MSQKLTSLSRLFINKPLYSPIVRQSLRTYTKEVSKIKEQQVSMKEKGGKFKELAKKYGPAGILVYLGVGCIDLGLTFATIQLVGSDKVKRLEHIAIETYHETKERLGFKTTKTVDDGQYHDHGKEIMKIENNDDDEIPSLASVFILAYGIHKTLLLPVRLAITTAITPALVRKIHALGWTKYAPRLFGIPKKP